MIREFKTWYSQTAKLIGYPVLFIVLITAIEKTMFTVTCALGEYQCEHSILGTEKAMDFVRELMTGSSTERVADKRSRQ
jgi:hypothetical protein